MSLVAQADWVVDVGPKAGVEESITARFVHPWPLHLNDAPRHPARSALKFVGITARNIVDQDVTIPLGQFTAVTGVSGSGKSTLVTHVIGRHVQNAVSTTVTDEPEEPPTNDAVTVTSVEGLDQIQRLVHIPATIGRTPRSVVATYTGLFDRVRRIFAETDQARRRDWGIGRFSFNVAEGRCPECSGLGQIEVELIFLPGSYATCPVCHGQRFNQETLSITWRGYTVADILALSVTAAKTVFEDEPQFAGAAGSGGHRAGLHYPRPARNRTLRW